MSSRRTKLVTITADNRDKGKVYKITEMSAKAGEIWAMRAIAGMAKSGVNMPDGFERLGWQGFAIIGLRAMLQMPFSDAVMLADEMMECVKMPMPGAIADRALILDGDAPDVEEISTLAHLKDEVFALHTGFSLAASLRARTAATPK